MGIVMAATTDITRATTTAIMAAGTITQAITIRVITTAAITTVAIRAITAAAPRFTIRGPGLGFGLVSNDSLRGPEPLSGAGKRSLSHQQRQAKRRIEPKRASRSVALANGE